MARDGGAAVGVQCWRSHHQWGVLLGASWVLRGLVYAASAVSIAESMLVYRPVTDVVIPLAAIAGLAYWTRWVEAPVRPPSTPVPTGRVPDSEHHSRVPVLGVVVSNVAFVSGVAWMLNSEGFDSAIGLIATLGTAIFWWATFEVLYGVTRPRHDPTRLQQSLVNAAAAAGVYALALPGGQGPGEVVRDWMIGGLLAVTAGVLLGVLPPPTLPPADTPPERGTGSAAAPAIPPNRNLAG